MSYERDEPMPGLMPSFLEALQPDSFRSLNFIRARNAAESAFEGVERAEDQREAAKKAVTKFLRVCADKPLTKPGLISGKSLTAWGERLDKVLRKAQRYMPAEELAGYLRLDGQFPLTAAGISEKRQVDRVDLLVERFAHVERAMKNDEEELFKPEERQEFLKAKERFARLSRDSAEGKLPDRYSDEKHTKMLMPGESINRNGKRIDVWLPGERVSSVLARMERLAEKASNVLNAKGEELEAIREQYKQGIRSAYDQAVDGSYEVAKQELLEPFDVLARQYNALSDDQKAKLLPTLVQTYCDVADAYQRVGDPSVASDVKNVRELLPLKMYNLVKRDEFQAELGRLRAAQSAASPAHVDQKLPSPQRAATIASPVSSPTPSSPSVAAPTIASLPSSPPAVATPSGVVPPTVVASPSVSPPSLNRAASSPPSPVDASSGERVQQSASPVLSRAVSAPVVLGDQLSEAEQKELAQYKQVRKNLNLVLGVAERPEFVDSLQQDSSLRKVLQSFSPQAEVSGGRKNFYQRGVEAADVMQQRCAVGSERKQLEGFRQYFPSTEWQTKFDDVAQIARGIRAEMDARKGENQETSLQGASENAAFELEESAAQEGGGIETSATVDVVETSPSSEPAEVNSTEVVEEGMETNAAETETHAERSDFTMEEQVKALGEMIAKALGQTGGDAFTSSLKSMGTHAQKFEQSRDDFQKEEPGFPDWHNKILQLNAFADAGKSHEALEKGFDDLQVEWAKHLSVSEESSEQQKISDAIVELGENIKRGGEAVSSMTQEIKSTAADRSSAHEVVAAGRLSPSAARGEGVETEQTRC